MYSKRLHVHSMPLVLFSLVATVVSAISVSTWQIQPVTDALLRPALRLESEHGLVKVVPNGELSEEQAGVEVEAGQGDTGVMRATQAADSIGLRIVLDNAVR